ncbi:hypothetical protein GCM10010381_38020 [Streptomyces xantholiticus]|nr:hypothetical protein GCM10010381_38020 [Streptomyces xantholiticus]
MPHSLQPPHDAAREVNVLTDACLPVHGVPDSVGQLIPQAATTEERLAAAVHPACVPGHRAAGSCRRRQLLALNAMRYGLLRRLCASPQYPSLVRRLWRPAGTCVAEATAL